MGAVDALQEPNNSLTESAPAITPMELHLSEIEVHILRFEARGMINGDAKNEAIRNELKMSGAQYYRLLGELIDRPAALQQDPVLVNRLLRLRETRQRERAARLDRDNGLSVFHSA